MEAKYPELRGITASEILGEFPKDDGPWRELIIRLLSKPNRNSERYARETLVWRVAPMAKALVHETVQTLQVIEDLEKILSALSLDMSWVVAVACFAAADAIIGKRSLELGIELRRPNGSFRSSRELLDMIIAREGGHNVRLKIFGVFTEEYRNSVVHNAEKIDEDMMREILLYTKHLFQFLTKTQSS